MLRHHWICEPFEAWILCWKYVRQKNNEHFWTKTRKVDTAILANKRHAESSKDSTDGASMSRRHHSVGRLKKRHAGAMKSPWTSAAAESYGGISEFVNKWTHGCLTKYVRLTDQSWYANAITGHNRNAEPEGASDVWCVLRHQWICEQMNAWAFYKIRLTWKTLFVSARLSLT
jgi:hypothetical protein